LSVRVQTAKAVFDFFAGACLKVANLFRLLV
jgi:hypothetical protein